MPAPLVLVAFVMLQALAPEGSEAHAGVLRGEPQAVRRREPPAGKLPPEVIQRVMRASHGAFRGCFEASLRWNPPPFQRIDVAFTIGRDGSTSRVSAKGSFPDAVLDRCIADRMKTVVFPQPEGGAVRVRYPIAFAPGE